MRFGRHFFFCLALSFLGGFLFSYLFGVIVTWDWSWVAVQPGEFVEGRAWIAVSTVLGGVIYAVISHE